MKLSKLSKMTSIFFKIHKNYKKFKDPFNLKCHFIDSLIENSDCKDELNLLH